MRLKKIVPFILLMTILAGKAAGQIFSPEASDSFGAAYNAAGGTDKVFIYNLENYQQGRTIAIVALPEDRQTGWNFDLVGIRSHCPYLYCLTGYTSRIFLHPGYAHCFLRIPGDHDQGECYLCIQGLACF